MDFNSLLLSIGDKLPKDGISAVTLKEKFERLNEDKQKQVATQLLTIKLQSPALVFWVGTFFFGSLGVGRFMIGDMVLGFVRLGLVIASIILGIFVVIVGVTGILLHIYNLLTYAVWIWWIVDMFLVGKKLRKQNFEKINKIIEGI
ncbi:hypothetical protein DU474_02655 [Campylobacter novaezeelandiae]|uniref:hypothetical protein n=1 Tax=Campylobacter novaezeelandiae TaxID=2267891 RepID=UPI001037B9C8|nr:hypothetical protein [Campylobacter novaezeelandiae]QWU80515.1 putative membrane protein [Campylobacter novaezeelandiae]TBR79876.1 hypothetical protein DU474_02655 [Campylobacter novaezeelandiae]